ncbi:hypothetical protein BJ875DRAFT_464055 [Amylocarpus encephaloides]|uniref:Tetratricopeptide repeat protein 36 n=1 Tax=Amylocarpus encephaloides TaxID=45428 RepID=A0A9P7YHU5_9HELO|nr:hypothetical protein BJ875DRAFT_464055 [Amylocarpus encephaloides]
MASAPLTPHDLSILERINNPEADPSAPLLIDSSLPKDPHITDTALYQKISSLEVDIIQSLQEAELQVAGLKPIPKSAPTPISQYETCAESLGKLIDEYPSYASARNNRAQAFRRLYGDGILVQSSSPSPDPSVAPPLLTSSPSALLSASTTLLNDIALAISLLTPSTPFAPLSPHTAKTLSSSYTQRGALYHTTAKLLSLPSSTLHISSSRPEAQWGVVDFEEAASSDFSMGGRYGNEVAKALAVAANPTAKLCGEMVRSAMRREYGGGGP